MFHIENLERIATKSAIYGGYEAALVYTTRGFFGLGAEREVKRVNVISDENGFNWYFADTAKRLSDFANGPEVRNLREAVEDKINMDRFKAAMEKAALRASSRAAA